MLSVSQKMLIARLLNGSLRFARGIVGRDMQVRCKRGGINWALDLDEGMDLSIYLRGAYEPATLRAYSAVIRPGDTVFDIGANIGAHTLHFARLAGPSGRVFAFEPTDYATAKLRSNLALNPDLVGVKVEQSFLVADATEPLPATVAARWPVANVHSDLDVDHFGKPEKLTFASAITADDYCDGAGIARLDFVKIDVDGYEYPVLRGFHRYLTRFRPRILIELAPFVYKNEHARDFDAFVHLLAELDYAFTEADSGRKISRDPAVLRKLIGNGAAMNCLLYPNSSR